MRVDNDCYQVDLLRSVANQESIDKQFKLSNDKATVFTAKALEHFAKVNRLDTPSEGWQLWIFVDEFRKRNATANTMRSEVAYWYKLDPFSLKDTEVLALKDNLHKLQCQERIHRGDYDQVDPNGVYQLFLHAFGDEELARKHQTHAAKLLVDRACKASRNSH